MKVKTFYKHHENTIVASLLLILLLVVIGIRYDYYYDLNDDVTMKDMLSGVYTGEPEAHNIQMLYPLSLVISVLYRIFPYAPVYGAVLCLFQYGSIWLVVRRSLGFGKTTPRKLLLAAVEGIAIGSLLAEHLVYVQYTFTCAMLGAAAAFLFVTTPGELTGKQFIKGNIVSILLALLAFLLRTEMLELLLPLLCVAGVYRWSLEKKILIKENFIKYLTIFGSLLAGMLVAVLINKIAFGSRDWKAYTEYFNSRTELYDFQGIPPYGGNEALYDELGLTSSERYMLLEQYNFGLDDSLKADTLDAISAYQAAHKKEQPLRQRLYEKLKLYGYRLLHKEKAGSQLQDDFPWNWMVLLGYLTVLLLAAGRAEGKGREKLWQVGKTAGILFFLFCVRTALWMFILIRGRDPIRITHSLYLMEGCILAAMLHLEGSGTAVEGRIYRKMGLLLSAVLTLIPIMFVPESLYRTDGEYEARAAACEVDRAIKNYCRRRQDNFYFIDVYSAVSYPLAPYQSTPYSEKMFKDVDNGLGNYDIMGGWLVKSPSYEKKLAAFRIPSMQEGILYQDNVYVMAELSKGTAYLISYFEDQNINITVELTDTIEDLIGVYRIDVKGQAGNRKP